MSKDGVELDNLLAHRWNPDNLYRFLSKKHPEVLSELGRICPECLANPLIDTGSEIVCHNCGVVVEEKINPAQYLPFGQTYALSASVVHGDSVGGTMPSGYLQQIISKPLDLEKVGLSPEDISFIQETLSRARDRPLSEEEAREVVRRYLRQIELVHIKTHLRNIESPKTMKLKTELTGLLDQHGLYSGQNYDASSHLLADQAGKIAEKVGRFLEAGMAKPLDSYRRLAAAILVWLIDQAPHLRRVCAEIRKVEEPDESDIHLIECLVKCPLLSNGPTHISQSE